MLTSVCIFCAATAIYFHAFLGEPSGPIAVGSLLAFYLLCSEIALWVQADAIQRGIELLYDCDSLIFLVWPYAALIYLFRTRGWDAFTPIGIFLLLQTAGILFAALLAYPHSIAYFRAHFS
jgi:hypothetical protein